MKKIYITAVVAVLTLMSCQPRADWKIVHHLNAIDWTNVEDTVIDLQEILGIEYDSLYLFEEYTNTDIPKVLGEAFPDWDERDEIADSHDRMILFHGGKAVYVCDIPTYKMMFDVVTERRDTVCHSYYAHYGSRYRVRCVMKTDGGSYSTKFYILKKEANGRSQYRRLFDFETAREYYYEL